VRGMLTLDYPDYRVVAVNDRSEDATGEILDRLAREYPGLTVIHNAQLPAGWLGKNYALYLATRQTQSDLILFTDADVHMAPSTLRRAVAYMGRRQLDLLALAPHARMPGHVLPAFAGAFVTFYLLYTRAWHAPDLGRREHVGIGAFNLVRRSVYERSGTHRAIAMRPDDDVRLGRIVKEAGGRQELAGGADCVTVQWYASIGELVRGFEKNAFAGLDYRLSRVVMATVAQSLTIVWPFLGVLLTSGWSQGACLLGAMAWLITYARMAPYGGISPWYAPALPLVSLLFQFIIWRATLITLTQGGMTWRGTFYSLDELRANA
jgi:cellulose synthase/poly-beta-1,6-N-acetylglucosamine synthase-like glycosyltransferase